MILILVVALFGLGHCTGRDGVSGTYRDFLENIKNVGDYGVNQYDQKEYINIDDKDDDENNGYRDLLDNSKNLGEYGVNQYAQKDNINIDDKSDDKNNGYRNSERDSVKQDKEDGEGERYLDKDDTTKNIDKDRFDSKNGDQENQRDFGTYYGEGKFDKYDGPKDYIFSDKSDKNDRSYNRYYGRYGSDIGEYDYIPKCDVNLKDCIDGKDCYDKAKDKLEYDKCRDTYGNEDRYYNEEDRYTGNRYQYNYYDDRYGYYKDCSNNTKNRADYDKCRRYYRRCSEYNRREYKYIYNEQDWKDDKDCGYDQRNLVGLGRNDREDQLIRPCALDDRQCIRKYLARNSNCKPTYGPIPDPLYLKKNTIYFPLANITMISTRARVTGLSNIIIREFYINKDTRNLVIALDFRNLNGTSPKVYLRYKRTGKESIVLSDYGTIEYKSGTFTAVIPKIPHLRLDLAEVHADIDDLIPVYFIGPRAVVSDDPDVLAGFARLNSNLPVATQELFFMQAQLLTAIYIQENLCDFGLKLISI